MPPAGPAEPSEDEKPAVSHNSAPATRLGRVANLLRQAGVRCGPNTGGVQELAADERITDELLTEALVTLNDRPEGKGSFGPKLVLIKVAELLNPRQHRSNGPSSDFPAWKTDDKQCDGLARKLGIVANRGEEYPQFRLRIGARLIELREQAAA